MTDIDWKNPFRIEDFTPYVYEKTGGEHVFLDKKVAQCISEHANYRFRKLIKEHGKRVWLCKGEIQTAHLAEPVDATHTAILIMEEEIK
jgi:hypothetical protein